MRIKTVHILGGGPAGCALSYYLSQKNIKSIVYESRNVLGGMARSWEWNDFTVDTGPHILHTDNTSIEYLWKSLLGENLVEGDFYAANYKNINGRPYFFDYPLNIQQLKNTSAWDKKKIDISIKKLQKLDANLALAKASSFQEYFQNLVGDHLEENFFRDYPEKVWGISTDKIIPDWAPKRIRVTESKEPFYTNEFASISSLGTGELFNKLIDVIPKNLVTIKRDCRVNSILAENNLITKLEYSHNGISKSEDIPPEDLVVSTLPVTLTSNLLGKSFDLTFRGILSVYTSFSNNLEGKILPDSYNWTYIADNTILPNRITEPTSMSSKLDTSGRRRPYLISEICCDQTTNIDQIESIVLQSIDHIRSLPFIEPEVADYSYNWEPYVYPVQSHENIITSAEAFSYISSSAKNLLSLGTSANFAYNDIQVIFQKASEMAEDINKLDQFNISNVFYTKNLAYSQDVHNSQDVVHKTPELTTSIQSPSIIAEIGINHNGSKDQFYSLCEEAASCGSSIVKFQYFKAKNRVGNVRELEHVEKAQDMEENIQEMLGRCELSISDICKAKEIVESYGSIAMCTAFSLPELKELLLSGFTNIKISSMDMNNVFIHSYLSNYSDNELNIFISTGMSNLDEIDMLYNLYKDCRHSVTLLYCVSSYPAPFDEVHLRCIHDFMNRYPNFKVGYSDHTVSNTAAKSSIFFGARFVEVHFTDNKNKSGPDQILSKTASDIKDIIGFYSEFSRMSVPQLKTYQSAEFKTWKTQKKGLYASRSISPGEVLDDTNTYLSTPPTDLTPLILADNTVRAKHNIAPAQPINLLSVEF